MLSNNHVRSISFGKKCPEGLIVMISAIQREGFLTSFSIAMEKKVEGIIVDDFGFSVSVLKSHLKQVQRNVLGDNKRRRETEFGADVGYVLQLLFTFFFVS